MAHFDVWLFWDPSHPLPLIFNSINIIFVSEARDAGRKPSELGKGNLLFWQRFKRDRESTVRKTMVYFLMFTSNDTGPLVTISQNRVKVKHGMFLNVSLSLSDKKLYYFTT